MEKTGTVLENEIVLLRKPEPEDLEFLFSLENNTHLWHLSDTKTPFSKWQIKQHIENSVFDIYTNKELRLIIHFKETGMPAGIVDLFEFDPINERAGLGIIIDTTFQNKGIAKQSLGLTIEYSFKHLQLKQLWCNILSDNYSSINLFSKFGFEKCGELKSWKKIEDTFKDVNIYQLLKQ